MESSVIDTLKTTLKLSDLAYLDAQGFQSGVNSLGLFNAGEFYFISTKSSWLVDAQVHLFIDSNTRTCYVACRGTQEWKDFFTDADYSLSGIGQDPAGKVIGVHSGFLQQYVAVRQRFTRYMTDPRLRTLFDKVVFCGHSLGGALATLILVTFAETWPDPSTLFLYTFASPRVGNKAFCEYFSQCCAPANHWRVFNNRDIISKLMTRTPNSTTSYQHLGGNSLRLYSKPDLRRDDMSSVVELWDQVSRPNSNDSFTYHWCSHYMRCLTELWPNGTLDSQIGSIAGPSFAVRTAASPAEMFLRWYF